MKTKLRILAAILCVVFLFGIVGACTSGTAPAEADVPPTEDSPKEADQPPADEGMSEEVSQSGEAPPPSDTHEEALDSAVITYMFWGDETEVERVSEMIDRFNAEHPGIIVIPEPVDRADIRSILTARALEGNLPDTGLLTEQMVIDLARAGFLGYSGGIHQEPVLDMVTFKWYGRSIAYSSTNETMIIYYDVDKFIDAGIDYPPATLEEAWTWGEFVDVCKQLTYDANGNNAKSWGFDSENIEQYGFYGPIDPWMIEAFALANGGGFFDPDDWSNIIIDQPETTEAIQRIADLHLVHHVSPPYGFTTEESPAALMLDENIAMVMSVQRAVGEWMADAAAERGLNYSVGVLPSMDEGNVTIATGGLSVVFEDTEHPREAATWLAWLASESSDLVQAGIGMPVYESWYTDEAKIRQWANKPNHPPFEDYRSAVVEYTMEAGAPAFWYRVPGAEPFLEVFNRALAPVWTGDMTASDAMGEAMPRFKAAIGVD